MSAGRARRASTSPRAARVHVAAAVLVNERGEVLVSRRADGAHQGGLWEFPGGKLEAGEDARAGLARELVEELGVRVEAARPLIRVSHDYADRGVLLDVWRVERWRGEVHGREGQVVEWVAPRALTERAFPAADVPVIAAVRLPETYLVTPEPEGDTRRFLDALAASVEAGASLVMLRAKRLEWGPLLDLARRAADVCHVRGATLVVNGPPRLAGEAPIDGVHLDSRRLARATRRPLPLGKWLAASCHDERELARAERIGADFVVLSPVKPTPGHPGAAPLGWKRFEALAAGVGLPIYALGGMRREDLPEAWRRGAQGIAAIRGLWKG